MLDHALGEDDELHVADDGDAAPRYRGGPESGVVGDAARDGGEVWMRGGEEVEGYVRREDFGGEGRGEESGEAGLEGLKGW